MIRPSASLSKQCSEERDLDQTITATTMKDVRFGEPYEITRTIARKHSNDNGKGKDLVIVPVEIEVDYCLYNMIDKEILENIRPDTDKMSFEEWVNICFNDRMNQILTNEYEFGKLLLGPLRQAHGLHTSARS